MNASRTPVLVEGTRNLSPLVALLGALLLLAPALAAGESQADATPGPGTAKTAAAGAVAGVPDVPLVLYWDEGKEVLTRTPIPGATTVVLSVAERRALLRSDSGLERRRQAEPGGGEVVDLQGRFQSVFVSLVDSTGKLRILCLDAEPKAGASPSEPTGGSRGR
ncbi:MAG: hypothetical protein IPN83_07725 [Holophagales bacterium]|nr:hypothetical protein [Holophagales bacterium]